MLPVIVKLRRRAMSSASRKSSSRPPTPTPTPMPILAASDSPPDDPLVATAEVDAAANDAADGDESDVEVDVAADEAIDGDDDGVEVASAVEDSDEVVVASGKGLELVVAAAVVLTLGVDVVAGVAAAGGPASAAVASLTTELAAGPKISPKIEVRNEPASWRGSLRVRQRRPRLARPRTASSRRLSGSIVGRRRRQARSEVAARVARARTREARRPNAAQTAAASCAAAVQALPRLPHLCQHPVAAFSSAPARSAPW